MGFLKAEEAEKNLVIPFYVDEKVLKIAIADLGIVSHNDPQLWQRLRRISGRKIDLYIAKFGRVFYEPFYRGNGTLLELLTNIASSYILRPQNILERSIFS